MPHTDMIMTGRWPPRGRNASDAMGQWLTALDVLPDRILCSTATRARQTCERAVRAGGWEAPVTYHKDLYHAHPETLLHYLHALPEGVTSVMLVGHQPVWSMTAGLLSGEAIGHFPTATIACVTLPITQWTDATLDGEGTLRWLQRPKELPEEFTRH